MKTHFTWIAFYKELSLKLLQFKNNRKPLVDFIQSGDEGFINQAGKSLVDYLHMQGGSPIADIDPFSVFAIFNRGRITYQNRQNICGAFKSHFGINAAAPRDFDGIPIVDPRRSFFFTWDINRNPYIIADMWELYERIVNSDEIEEWFDKVLSNGFPKYSLTMALYWLDPEKYMTLDSRSRSFLETYGITKFDIKDYNGYVTILDDIKSKIQNKRIPYKHFAEISYAAWHSSSTNPSNEINMKKSSSLSDTITLLQDNKNLILTGAPGTGKTHMAMELAYELGADEKSIRKVQFHPSYDYTDFVEGIRPQEDNSFKRVDGEFKEFCKRAMLAQTTDDNMMVGLNDNPKVWKVSLKGTGDNDVRQDCLENGYIRIGWPAYKDIDFTEYNPNVTEGKKVLKAFQSAMQIGDIVVSCYTEKVTDAIGIITGDYEYDEKGGDYPRYRTVRWLAKNIRENIMDVNGGKRFTLSTVYLSNIKPAAALEIAQKHSDHTQSKINKPFVFIIDEINRGELSKIFGELFGAIEKGYRGEKGRVRTQYQNMIAEGDPFKEGFYVPENVYIIGTMNDIDRSVESMDFAMRRRFAWKEVTAAERYDAIIANNNAFNGNKAEVEAHMARLNAKIKESLGQAYQIGAAYFLELKNDDFEALWKNHLEGLIFEYFRGERDAEQKVEELHGIFING